MLEIKEMRGMSRSGFVVASRPHLFGVLHKHEEGQHAARKEQQHISDVWPLLRVPLHCSRLLVKEGLRMIPCREHAANAISRRYSFRCVYSG